MVNNQNPVREDVWPIFSGIEKLHLGQDKVTLTIFTKLSEGVPNFR